MANMSDVAFIEDETTRSMWLRQAAPRVLDVLRKASERVRDWYEDNPAIEDYFIQHVPAPALLLFRERDTQLVHALSFGRDPHTFWIEYTDGSGRAPRKIVYLPPPGNTVPRSVLDPTEKAFPVDTLDARTYENMVPRGYREVDEQLENMGAVYVHDGGTAGMWRRAGPAMRRAVAEAKEVIALNGVILRLPNTPTRHIVTHISPEGVRIQIFEDKNGQLWAASLVTGQKAINDRLERVHALPLFTLNERNTFRIVADLVT